MWSFHCKGRRAFLVLVPVTTLALLWKYYRHYNNKSKLDRISELPDDVLHRIIKNLKLREIVQLSTLSKRWRRVCLESAIVIPKLCFDWTTMYGNGNNNRIEYYSVVEDDAHPCYSNKDRFIKGVNQSTEFTKKAEISSLELNFCLEADSSTEIDSWIRFAIGKGVEALTIHLSCDYVYDEVYYDDRSYIFRSELLASSDHNYNNNVSKLRKLSMKSCIVEEEHRLFDKLVGLTALKLKNIKVTEQLVKVVLSSCSNLEILGLQHCSLPSKLCISPSGGGERILQLKQLDLRLCRDAEEMEVSAPNLRDIIYFGLPIIFSFGKVPSLKTMSLVVICTPEDPCFLDSNQFTNWPSLEGLSVTADTHWLYCLPQQANRFSKLKELRVFTTSFMNFQIQDIVYILTTCQILEDLMIYTKYCGGDEEDIAPVHHSKLKQVILGKFHRIWEQIDFVKYLLTCTIALEKMFIDLGTRSSEGSSERILHTYRGTVLVSEVENKASIREPPKPIDQQKVARLLGPFVRPGLEIVIF